MADSSAAPHGRIGLCPGDRSQIGDMHLIPALLPVRPLGARTLRCIVLLSLGTAALAQQVPSVPSSPVAAPASIPAVAPPVSAPSAAAFSQSSANAAAPHITLDQAISRARANEPTFAAAVAAQKNAALDHSIARAALLPNVDYHNQFLYTQPARCPVSNAICAENAGVNSGNASIANPAISSGAPRFIANNAIHEYVSQGLVTETIGLQQFNALSRASAAEAVATAELEVARRGLVASVANLFYSGSTSARRVQIADRAATEAAAVTQLTQQRETAREVAHADVIKAQLDQQQRERDLSDARLNADKARLELGVLLFPDPRTPYILELPSSAAPVPARADVEAALAKRNPELQSAIAGAHLADLGVTAARAAYLPNLQFAYSYGIDASQMAIHAPDGSRNLGYSAGVTIDIPIWDWLATRDKIRQSQISRNVAHVVLTNTQRRLVANLEESYAEAQTAHDQLDSLTQSVNTAQESLRLTRLSYTAGETTILSVVDAEHSLTAAETALEDGVVRYQTALANLQLLTGTL
jgi:outer membrane protein